MSTFPGGFVPVAPPADGLRLAFVAARRRRQRKAGAAGVAGLLAAVSVFAMSGSGGNTTLLQEPVPPAADPGLGVLPGTGADAPASTPPSAATSQPGSASSSRAMTVSREGNRTNGAETGSSSTGAGGRAHRTATRPIYGPMQRNSGFLYTGGDLVCPARKQQERQRGLCTDVYVSNGSGGSTITAEICNVGTQTELLSFATALEVDLRVMRASTVVWRWSAGRHFAATPHDMTIATQECVMWQTVWSHVDSHGAKVKPGSYTVVADLQADEVAVVDRHPSYPISVS